MFKKSDQEFISWFEQRFDQKSRFYDIKFNKIFCWCNFQIPMSENNDQSYK